MCSVNSMKTKVYSYRIHGLLLVECPNGDSALLFYWMVSLGSPLLKDKLC